MPRIVFEEKGVFVEYKEKKYYMNGEEVPNRIERPTKLWYQLKEAIKGKEVTVVVIEDDGVDPEGRVYRGQMAYQVNDAIVYQSKTKNVATKRIEFDINGIKFYIENKDGRVIMRFDRYYKDKVIVRPDKIMVKIYEQGEL